MKQIIRNIQFVVVAIVLSLFLSPWTAFAYLAAPIALTSAPTFITENSARLNGQVNGNEMPDAYQWFEWGVVGRADNVYETPHRAFRTGNQLTNVSETISGLAPNMQYFYRQVAESGRGKDRGNTTYFTTKPLPVVVTPLVIVQTVAPNSITEISANLNGYFSPHGNTSAQWWFEWGKTTQLENKTPVSRSWTSNSGPVNTKISGLTPGTTYFYRLVGENDLGQVYGATRVFVTHGKLPEVISEAPRNQAIQIPTSGDDVNRKVTTSGSSAVSSSQSQSTSAGFPGVNAGEIMRGIFQKKPSTSVAPSPSASSDVTETQQIAGVGNSGPLGAFWDSMTNKKSIEVIVEKVGPEKVSAHTAIEYRVSYTYRLETPGTSAQLKIILPENVVYIGDNTENELLLQESSGPERIYILPVGRLEKGTSRTISLLAMTTGSANGTFPDARARLEYVDSSNTLRVVAAGASVTPSSGVNDSSQSHSFFPSSFFGWLFYVLLIVFAIIAVRKAMAYYRKRKEEIAKEEELQARTTSVLKNNEVVV